jgi:hypothetical protein
LRANARLVIAPILNGQPADPEAIAKLPVQQQQQLEATHHDLEDALADALRVVRERDKEAKAKLLDRTKVPNAGLLTIWRPSTKL